MTYDPTIFVERGCYLSFNPMASWNEGVFYVASSLFSCTIILYEWTHTFCHAYSMLPLHVFIIFDATSCIFWIDSLFSMLLCLKTFVNPLPASIYNSSLSFSIVFYSIDEQNYVLPKYLEEDLLMNPSRYWFQKVCACYDTPIMIVRGNKTFDYIALLVYVTFLSE